MREKAWRKGIGDSILIFIYKEEEEEEEEEEERKKRKKKIILKWNFFMNFI
jgi:hypothetical protein